MNSDQFARHLKKLGIKVIANPSGDGHKDLYNPATDKWSQLPTHGGRKQLGTGLMNVIKKQLGLK